CALVNNRIEGDEGYGGAILNIGSGATLIINNSIIHKNYAYAGGGIWSDAQTTIQNSRITYNSGLAGGGVTSVGSNSNITLERCAVHNNTANDGAAFRGNNYWTVKE